MYLTLWTRFFIVATAISISGLCPGWVTADQDIEDIPIVEPDGLKSRSSNAIPSSGTIIEILKGDEIVLDTGDKIRMIGIDAPIAHFNQRTGDYYGKAGFDFVVDSTKGKPVSLEYDVQPRDKFNRLLAYVYLENGKMLNEELIRQGNAVAACFPPNTSKCATFAAAQDKALGSKQGLWNFDTSAWPKIESSAAIETSAMVDIVQDGDTIVLESGKLLRYIGIDAAESTDASTKGGVGNPAYELNTKLVKGKQVRMEFDRKLKDPRGRYLAYVYVMVDGKEVFVNEHLVKAGVAWVAAFPPNVSRLDELLIAQKEAYKHRRGMWNFGLVAPRAVTRASDPGLAVTSPARLTDTIHQ